MHKVWLSYTKQVSAKKSNAQVKETAEVTRFKMRHQLQPVGCVAKHNNNKQMWDEYFLVEFVFQKAVCYTKVLCYEGSRNSLFLLK